MLLARRARHAPLARRGLLLLCAFAALVAVRGRGVVWAQARPQPPPDRLVTVAVDVRHVADADYRRLGLLALERKLALRLTQVGFAFVAPQRQPDVRLVFEVAGVRLLLGAGAGGRTVLREVSAPASGTARALDAFHLEVIHKAVEAARQVAPRPAPASRPSSVPTTAAVLVPPPRPAPVRRPPPAVVPAPDPWYAEPGLVVAALYRVQGVDPLLRAGLRVGRARGLGVHAAVTVAPTFGARLTVVEWSGQLGAAYRFVIARPLDLEVVGLVGLQQHVFQLGAGAGAGATAADGSRFGFVATLAADLGWWVHRHLRFRAWLAPGLSDRSRRHQVDGQTIWERSLFRLEGGLGGALVF